MKSAYERAMERLAEDSPSRQLSDEEKTEIAGIDNRAEARLAEIRITYGDKMAVVNPMDAQELQQEMASEIARAEEQRDAAKDEIWNRESK